MLPRPRFRLPLTAALAIVGLAYLARGFVMRGGDLSPDMPSDLVVLVLVVIATAIVGYLRTTAAADDSSQPTADEHEERCARPTDERDDDGLGDIE